MARKSDQGIIELQEAIAEMKRIRAQISDDNKYLSEEIDMGMHRLFEGLFAAVSQKFGKSKN